MQKKVYLQKQKKKRKRREKALFKSTIVREYNELTTNLWIWKTPIIKTETRIRLIMWNSYFVGVVFYVFIDFHNQQKYTTMFLCFKLICTHANSL